MSVDKDTVRRVAHLARIEVADSDLEPLAKELSAILNFANAVVEKRGWVEDSDLQGARDAGLTDGQIIEVIANVSLNIFTNYFNHAADTEVDFPSVQLPAGAAG